MCAGTAKRKYVCGFQPEVHASFVRRRAAAGTQLFSVSLSRRIFRSDERRTALRTTAPALAANQSGNQGWRDLCEWRRGGDNMKKPLTHEQRMTIVYGILCLVLIIVMLQLWLLMATMNAYLGGEQSVILPAALASLGCLGLNAGLLWY